MFEKLIFFCVVGTIGTLYYVFTTVYLEMNKFKVGYWGLLYSVVIVLDVILIENVVIIIGYILDKNTEKKA
jgi:hypothetical protein